MVTDLKDELIEKRILEQKEISELQKDEKRVMDMDFKDLLKDILLRSRKIPEAGRPKWVHLDISSGQASYRLGEELDSEIIFVPEIKGSKSEQKQKKKVQGPKRTWLED